jgi:predicted amidophosphoribosyltransferase
MAVIGPERDWGYLDPPDLYAEEPECPECGQTSEGCVDGRCPACGADCSEDALRDAAETAAEPPEWH